MLKSLICCINYANIHSGRPTLVEWYRNLTAVQLTLMLTQLMWFALPTYFHKITWVFYMEGGKGFYFNAKVSNSSPNFNRQLGPGQSQATSALHLMKGVFFKKEETLSKTHQACNRNLRSNLVGPKLKSYVLSSMMQSIRVSKVTPPPNTR